MGARVRPVELSIGPSLEDQGLVDGQASLVAPFLSEGRALADRVGTSRIWMVNSTSSGGGVAEMLPHTCRLLREVGLDARWLVLEPDDARFFDVTKRVHHQLHGKSGGAPLTADDAALFERVSREGAHSLVEHLERGDVVVVHDPQPSALPDFLPRELQTRLAWRCHVGVPSENEHTRAAWSFLEPWLAPYETLLFSSERYVPSQFRSRSGILAPAIDALSHKNRELPPYKLLGVLRSGGLLTNELPAWARFAARARRYDGTGFVEEPLPDLLWSPVILQVSRFDRLKGFDRSIAAFRVIAEEGRERAGHLRVAVDRATDELARCLLVLAGPDPSGVVDDPEAQAVLDELCALRDALPPDVAARVHILKLPMVDAKQNALLVNALQRLASVIVQPSTEEGFGLTVTEAMWKGVPIVGTNVGGIAQQIRPGVDGFIVEDPNDIDALADAVLAALVVVKQSERMARSARHRVAQHFLSLREAMRWLDIINGLVVHGVAHAESPHRLKGVLSPSVPESSQGVGAAGA